MPFLAVAAAAGIASLLLGKDRKEDESESLPAVAASRGGLLLRKDRKEDESGRRIKGRGAQSRTVRASFNGCGFYASFSLSLQYYIGRLQWRRCCGFA
jgi:hypothetical protein